VFETFCDSILLRFRLRFRLLRFRLRRNRTGTVINSGSGSAKAKSYGSYGSGSITLTKTQSCGSGMFIPDPTFFHPGSRIQGSKRHPIPDPESGSATLLKLWLLSLTFYLMSTPGRVSRVNLGANTLTVVRISITASCEDKILKKQKKFQQERK
jgi:hypothetical protein